jgi:hypothetical protein
VIFFLDFQNIFFLRQRGGTGGWVRLSRRREARPLLEIHLVFE